MAQLVDEHYQKYQTSPFRAPEHVKTLLQQLLSAMDHVHAHCSLIHRDVKLSNLLYQQQQDDDSKKKQGGGGGSCLLKLCDFGLARTYSNDYYYQSVRRSDAAAGEVESNSNNNQRHHHLLDAVRLLTPNVVSLWYRAPELLLGAGSSYTQAIDMWAVGCVFAELVLGRPLLNGTTELQQVEQIFDVVGVPPSKTTTSGRITTIAPLSRQNDSMPTHINNNFSLMICP
jgi:serine/threonine protein kinase